MHGKKDVKKHLLNHSEAKVRLLSEYLKRYLSIICNDGYTNKINVYDLFCGEGLYANGGEGSPLVIMRAIKSILNSSSGRMPQIDCLFNDIDQTKVRKVNQAILAKSLYRRGQGSLDFSSYDYKKCLAIVEGRIQSMKNEKAFVFIDPYGYKNVKMSHIKGLMKGNKSEVLLWLPTQHMYRFDGDGAPAALKDFIEELMPMNNWRCSDNVWDFVESLKEGFQKSMGNAYFVENFTIQKDKNTVFCLFFFTSHIKGFEKILESKWKIDGEEGKGWNYMANQMGLFSHQKTHPLETKLVQYISQKPATNFDLYEFTLRQGFQPKHAREVLMSLQERKIIKVFPREGLSPKKGSFYLSYKEYKNREKGIPKITVKKL